MIENGAPVAPASEMKVTLAPMAVAPETSSTTTGITAGAAPSKERYKSLNIPEAEWGKYVEENGPKVLQQIDAAKIDLADKTLDQIREELRKINITEDQIQAALETFEKNQAAAGEKTGQPKAETGIPPDKQTSDGTPKPEASAADAKAPEAPSETVNDVQAEWKNASKLVEQSYNINPADVAKQLQDLGLPTDASSVAREINKRKDYLASHKALARALDIKRAINQTWEAYQDRLKSEEAKKNSPLTPAEIATIRKEYIQNEQAGEYYPVVGSDRKPDKTTILNQRRAQGAIIDELTNLALEPTVKTPQAVKRAQEAKSLHDSLSPRLARYPDGTVTLDVSENKLEVKRINAIAAADAVAQNIIMKAADDIKAQKTPKVDFYLSSLSVWRKELQDLPADATPETVNAYVAILTTATNELLDAHPGLRNDPSLAGNLALLKNNSEYYQDPKNDPLAKRVKEIMIHMEYPLAGGNIDTLIRELSPAKMMLITASLDAAVQADQNDSAERQRSGRKPRAAELVDGLLTQGIISGEQGRFLSHLVQSQDVRTFTNTCADELRLTPAKLKELSNPLEYLKKNAEGIANMIFGGKVSEKILSAFKALTKLTPEMIAKYIKEHGLPMNQIMIVMMVLPMIQGTLGFSGDGGEERGGGGG